MTISATKTVRELVNEIPVSTRVFEKLGIDYCCGGGQSLQEACSSAGVQVEEVVNSLEQTIQSESQHDSLTKNWTRASLAELISHIVGKHHAYVKQELPRITGLCAKVCGVHGQNHSELLRIQQAFQGLNDELTSHLYKEEGVLFPYIEEMEIAVGKGRRPSKPHFGTVNNPVRMMMMEHDKAGGVLREIREASSDFTVPADGCTSYGTLYGALEDFEKDLHEHIHLENNILFPRAIEMESRSL